MHTYAAVTKSGLYIHLSMVEEQSFYILVYDTLNYTAELRYFTNVELARNYIRAIKE